MSEQTYEVGDVITAVGKFKRIVTSSLVNDEPTYEYADPDTVVLTITSPSGVESTKSLAGGTVVKVTLGIFYAKVSTTEPGTWVLEWSTTGDPTVYEKRLVPVGAQ